MLAARSESTCTPGKRAHGGVIPIPWEDTRHEDWSSCECPRVPRRAGATEGSVVGFILEGAIRSKVNDGPEKVYQAGESWLEPPGAAHPVSANASATEPARLLAVFVAEDGAELTTFDR